MIKFYGEKKRNSYFEGWYFKQQGQSGTLALIPAYHKDASGYSYASLQIITEKQSYYLHYSIKDFQVSSHPFYLRIGNNEFSERGCRIETAEKGIRMSGNLKYGSLAVPSYDIMGPFRLIPFMQCRHSVFSMGHKVNGYFGINEEAFLFQNGFGYVEGDRGSSFPEKYLWTQCSGKNFSIMLSVAKIPFMGTGFTGCTGFFFYKGKEYRIATYLGARVIYADPDYMAVEQKGYIFEAHRLDKGEGNLCLKAPQNGNMRRIIRESVACTVRYRLRKEGKTVFSFQSGKAAFEGEWEKEIFV